MNLKPNSKTKLCDCGRQFKPKTARDTMCTRCKEEMGIILNNEEFEIFSSSGMKKRITGEFNMCDDSFFKETDLN